MKTLSCGILVFDREAQLLLGHATGLVHWDIPKGMCDPGETPLQAAVREGVEETGLVFEPESLTELGRFAYRPGKDLHLFASLYEQVDAAQLRCTTFFRDRAGRLRPELDRFAWVPLDEVPQRCAKSMAALLAGPVPLRDVWRRLVGA
jgi:8-oxo-dGTP pyrophosphatase MutT (NUDIX family)